MHSVGDPSPSWKQEGETGHCENSLLPGYRHGKQNIIPAKGNGSTIFGGADVYGKGFYYGIGFLYRGLDFHYIPFVIRFRCTKEYAGFAVKNHFKGICNLAMAYMR